MCERELQDAPSEAERSFFKNGTMAVMWCARACRFEALGTAAKLIHVVEKSTVQDLVDFQKTIKVSKEAADVGTVFRPIHPAEVVFGHDADGSLPENGEIHSHGGCLVFVTTRGLAPVQRSPVHLLAGRCGKSKECALVHCHLKLARW